MLATVVRALAAAAAEGSAIPLVQDVIAKGLAAAYDALKQRFDGGGDLPAAILVNSISTFEGFATLWRNDRRLFAGVRVGCFDWDPFAACLPIDSFMLRQDVEGLSASCFRWFDAGEERAGERVMVAPRLMVDDLEPRDSSAA